MYFQSRRKFGYSSVTGLQYVQIDLGATYPVNKVVVWHYNGDGRTYHNTKTQVSANGSTWVTVFDSATQGEYAETLAGKTHTFTQQNVRYVRDYLNGSTVNTGNHWTEIEVWGTTSTAYVGDYFEWNGSLQTMTKYYYAGGQRVAVRNSNGTGTNGLVYLLGDHLGSASLTADPVDGDKLSELRYKAWGETRYALTSLPTDRRYTGQVEEATIGLHFFNARWYDSALGRWAQPDSIVPMESQGVQAWDRYAFVNNNPVRYNDPSGHDVGCGGRDASACEKKDPKPPPITMDDKYGVCINAGNIGCSGTIESNINSMKNNISMIPYGLNQEKEQIKDTYSLMWGWNLSLSTPGNYSTLGQEEVVIFSDGTRATYNYIGEGSSIGFGANTVAYMGVVANLETPDQYKGVAAAVGVTVSVGDVGVTIGYFWDSSKPPLTAGIVQGVMVGYAPGASASVWNSTSNYHLTWQTR